MRRLDHEGLRAFSAIIDFGGFRSAGIQLNKSQASVSAALAKLEQGLGQKLIERTTRKLSLTSAGHLLLDYARRMQALEEEAIEVVGGGAFGRRIRIGMPDDYLASVGTRVVSRFALSYPRTQVETLCDFSSRLEEMVYAGAIDLAVITREAAKPRGEFLRLEPLAWFGPHEPGPELERELPLALFPEGCRARPHILAALRQAGRPWRVVYSSSHFYGVEAACASGMAVTALPRCTASSRLRELTHVPGLPSLPPVELAVIVPPQSSPAARRLAMAVKWALQPAEAAAG
jgi:DNA-binding transcriptional LysR family regulator